MTSLADLLWDFSMQGAQSVLAARKTLSAQQLEKYASHCKNKGLG